MTSVNKLPCNQTDLDKAREKLKEIVNSNFRGTYHVLEICLSVKAQVLIEGITLPFCLILLGIPSSYKTTILDIVGSLPSCYRSDSFTAKSFVTHSTNVKRSELSSIDLLPKIRNQTLVTPELAPIFSAKDDNLLEIIGILTRILDGKGYQNDSGTHGRRGYTGDYFFTWVGASVEISHKVWRLLGNLGAKMLFLRIPTERISEQEKQQRILSSLKDNSYNSKLEEAKDQVKIFWDLIVKNSEKKISWNASKDEQDALAKISLLAQLLGKIRASIPTWQTASSGGSNYNYEHPIEENPERAAHYLYNLAKGHAVLYGRNYITKEDLIVVVPVVLSSTSIERVELLRILVTNGGVVNTDLFMKEGRVSRATALKNMEQLELIGLVESKTRDNLTKPITEIRLKEYYHWLLTEEFGAYCQIPIHRVKNSKLSLYQP